MVRRIYIDTSTAGGCFEAGRRSASRRLFDRFRAGRDVMVVSDVLLAELSGAPDHVRDVVSAVPAAHSEEVGLTPEARALAEAYVAANVIGPAHRADARHIAVATVHHVSVLVSWNFKHIVNLNRIRGYNAVNIRSGYHLLEIRSPEEVMDYE